MQEGIVIAHYGAHLGVETTDGALLRCAARQQMPELVCGDRVRVQKDSMSKNAMIIALLPRQTVLVRTGYGGQIKLVAANIDQMLVVSAAEPGIDYELIDRYIVAAELPGIRPLLVINKVDRLAADHLHGVQVRMQIYAQLGYEVLYTSVKTGAGMVTLTRHLQGHTSIVVGQSGVGKSSLVNNLYPDAEIRIGELSERSGLGKHTTSTAMLYHLPEGGDLIDSPGVREFRLDHIEADQLAQGFIEFRDFSRQCKYNNCQHLVEPECAVRAAVERGVIAPQRYASYCRTLRTPL